MKDFIHQVEPYVTEAEGRAVSEYLASGGWLTEFTKTRELEEAIAAHAGVKHGICLPSGTVGLYLALLGAGIGPGDRVAVPNYTMIATINVILWCGAEPVLCDVDPVTFCADVSTIPDPGSLKAFLYVEMNGRAGDLPGVLDFCARHGITLIEDAAQAMGSSFGGKALGTFGLAGVYSFTPHKIITTGQGGIVLTDDDAMALRVRKLKDFHRVGAGVDDHDGIGYNFKFTDVQAVIGLEQFKLIEFRIRRKRELYARYRDALAKLPGVHLFEADLGNCAPWFVDILLPSQAKRDELIVHLKENGIGSRKFYPPINSQAPFRHFAAGSFPVSEDMAPRGLWLPSSIGITEEQIDRVCEAIEAFVSCA